MKPGDRVCHPKYGAGSIVAIFSRAGHMGAEVDFGWAREWVSAQELGLTISADPPKVSQTGRPVKTKGIPRISSDIVEARRGVFALKLGQVLEKDVLHLSTGTANAEKQLRGVVESALGKRAKSVLIEGAWGSGKTHLLTMLTAIANEKDMATSSIILDGVGTELSNPMSLLEAIFSSLRYPNESIAGGFRGKIAAFRKAGMDYSLSRKGGERVAKAIMALRSDAVDEPEVMHTLEDYFSLALPASHANDKLKHSLCSGMRLPPMRALKVEDRAERFCELLKAWTGFVTLTGAKGLVLVIDEVDVEYASTRWDSEKRYRRGRLLISLKKLMKDRIPLVIAFGSAPAQDEDLDQEDPIEALKSRIGGVDLTIKSPPPRVESLRALGAKIYDLYRQAYPEREWRGKHVSVKKWIDAFAETHIKSELHPVPRTFVRGTLEYLDIAITSNPS